MQITSVWEFCWRLRTKPEGVNYFGKEENLSMCSWKSRWKKSQQVHERKVKREICFSNVKNETKIQNELLHSFKQKESLQPLKPYFQTSYEHFRKNYDRITVRLLLWLIYVQATRRELHATKLRYSEWTTNLTKNRITGGRIITFKFWPCAVAAQKAPKRFRIPKTRPREVDPGVVWKQAPEGRVQL